MAIKNTKLGGTDWAIGDNIKAADMNDTVNALVDKVQSLSNFWLNSFLSDTYDDFSSYSVGTFTTNSKWNITLGKSIPETNPRAEIVSATTAGGTGKELQLIANTTGYGSSVKTSSATATTLSLVANRHTYCKLALDLNKNSSAYYARQTVQFGNATDGWSTVFTRNGATNTSNIGQILTSVLVVARGGNLYDVYYAGKLMLSSVSKPNGAQLSFTAADEGDRDEDFGLYLGQVFQSKTSVT